MKRCPSRAPVTTILKQALKFHNRLAVVTTPEDTSEGSTSDPDIFKNQSSATRSFRFTYYDILSCALPAAAKIRETLSGKVGNDVSHEAKIGLMTRPGAEYVCGLFAIWLSGGVAVPLSLSNPIPELAYVVNDSETEIVLATRDFTDIVTKTIDQCRGSTFEPTLQHLAPVSTNTLVPSESLPALQSMVEEAEECLTSSFDRGALIIYTSGTTGRPKGALHTFSSLQAQIESMCAAWEWNENDQILHGLPLHHIHGIVNALLCPLMTGACIKFLPRFSPRLIWKDLMLSGDDNNRKTTVFMAVPTMYVILIRMYASSNPETQRDMRKAASGLRLTVSGSAACPVPIMNQWAEISGSKLLERYGMTEIGMALSNPYRGERRAGTVGKELPFVECKISIPSNSENESSQEDMQSDNVITGELLVRGPTLFKEYIGKPKETAESFDSEGFFKTGDTVRFEEGIYTILGRSSVDIIKMGGYKLSALEIENCLLTHQAISEVAILGLHDEKYGEIVAALVVLENHALDLKELQAWCRERLASYKIPSQLRVTERIPRNAMGKVNKASLKSFFES